MCRGLQVGNNNLSGNVEMLDQRLSEGQVWLNLFQPDMAPNAVTEVRQSLNTHNPPGCSQPSEPVRFMHR